MWMSVTQIEEVVLWVNWGSDQVGWLWKKYQNWATTCLRPRDPTFFWKKYQKFSNLGRWRHLTHHKIQLPQETKVPSKIPESIFFLFVFLPSGKQTMEGRLHPSASTPSLLLPSTTPNFCEKNVLFLSLALLFFPIASVLIHTKLTSKKYQEQKSSLISLFFCVSVCFLLVFFLRAHEKELRRCLMSNPWTSHWVAIHLEICS